MIRLLWLGLGLLLFGCRQEKPAGEEVAADVSEGNAAAVESSSGLEEEIEAEVDVARSEDIPASEQSSAAALSEHSEIYFLFNIVREGRHAVRVLVREEDELRQVDCQFHAVADSIRTGRGGESWRVVWLRTVRGEELVLRRNDASGTDLVLPFRKVVRVPAL